MIGAYTPLLSYLGIVAGVIIARFVQDETEWYEKQFFWSAAILAVITGVFGGVFYDAGIWTFSWSTMLVGALLGVGFAYSLYRQFWIGLLLCTTALTFSASVFAWELAFVMFIPSTAYIINKGFRKQLIWFLASALMVVIVIALSIA